MPESLGRTLCAFANTPSGGTIVLGVDEAADFEVTGVQDEGATQEAVASLCREAVDPAPHLLFHSVSVDGSTVLVVTVVPLLDTHKPALYQGRAYRRRAGKDDAMTTDDLRMVELAQRPTAERLPADAVVEEGLERGVLDDALTDDLLANATQGVRRLGDVDEDARVLEVLNVTARGGGVRRAGLYAVGFLPQSTFPALGATAHVTGGTDDPVHFVGPLPDLLDESLDWVRRHTAEGAEESPLPLSAVREALSNAFIHREMDVSLEAGRQVEIRLSANELTITSPGGLKNLTTHQLGDVELVKAPVNQRLYGLARWLETSDGAPLVATAGGGVTEMLRAVHEAGLARPRFVDEGTAFRVVFPRVPRLRPKDRDWVDSLPGPFTPVQEDMLVMVRRGEDLSLQRLRTQFPWCTDEVLEQSAQGLAEKGLLATGVTTGEAPVAAALATDDAELEKLGKNVPQVFRLLKAGGKQSISEMHAATTLSVNQVRYAVNSLLDAGLVGMEGGRGKRTTYFLH
ncbi:RNA-binding domain-containing protein [Corynebacterium timonense]|uniref:RNA-binding domain-containing protein n=1 Tax=Corynebacterium timonense TaxID=441500 RepID=UPI0015608118|nr:RNA-binding domain-containing protein [Corynebacterium timonense]